MKLMGGGTSLVRPKRTGTSYGAHEYTAHTLTTPAGPADSSISFRGSLGFYTYHILLLYACAVHVDAYRIARVTKAFVADFHNANYVRLQHLFVGRPAITHWPYT